MEKDTDSGLFLADFLAEVEVGLEEAFQGWGQAESLARAGRHLCLQEGAKRVRPRLIELFGRAFDLPRATLVDLAVSAELIHSASLLHDDVIDQGTERRGVPTANLLFGNLRAVLTGDLVLTEALKRLRAHPPALLHLAIDTVAEMTQATVAEVEARAQAGTTAEQWERIAQGKTGALFAFCGAAVGLAAGRPEVAEGLSRYGRHLGLAFQMADDLKDVLDPSSGKPLYADLRAGNPGLPLVRGAERSEPFREALEALWAGPLPPREAQIEAAAAELLRSGAIEAVRASLNAELDAADAALAPFGDRPQIAQVVAFTNQRLRPPSALPVSLPAASAASPAE